MATVAKPSLVGVVAETDRGPEVLFLGCNLSNDFSQEVQVSLAVGLKRAHTATIIELTFTIEAKTKRAVLHHYIDFDDDNQMELFNIMVDSGHFYFAANDGELEDNQPFRTSAKKLPLGATFQADLKDLLRAGKRHEQRLGARKNFKAAVRDLIGN